MLFPKAGGHPEALCRLTQTRCKSQAKGDQILMEHFPNNVQFLLQYRRGEARSSVNGGEVLRWGWMG